MIVVLLISGVRIYAKQTECLNDIHVQQIQKEAELEIAKAKYEELCKLEQLSNSSESKENQIRERLNMIKKDEIQFLFSSEE